jgi:preprotein translocase subunit SecG
MDMLITSLHVLAAIFLISVVLMQHGKGADIGAAFGGGSSQTVFGSRGAGNFLTKMTTAFVVIFMITSITLAYFSTPQPILEGAEDELAPTAIPEGALGGDDPIEGATPIEGTTQPEAGAAAPSSDAPSGDAGASEPPAAEAPAAEPGTPDGAESPAAPQ